MDDLKRCEGILPGHRLCPWAKSCLRFLKIRGDDWIEPRIEGDRCFDRITELGQRMNQNA